MAVTIKNVYRVNHNGIDYWFNWTDITEVIQSPVVSDVHNRIYFTTNGNAFVCRAQDQVGQVGWPSAYYLLGITAPSTQVTITPSGGTEDLSTTRAYVFTYVSQWGEESGPSPAITATGNADGTWQIDGITTCPNNLGEVPVIARRLYRTSTADDGSTDYQLVAAIEDNGTTSFLDAVPELLLGETLPAVSYLPPPRGGVAGITLMGNGIVAIFKGKSVYFSDPYLPHAFPDEYRRTVEFNIVGMAAIGNSLAVMTTGDPILMTGADPAGISEQKLDVNQPCLSRRSIVALGDAVGYASPDGVVLVSMGGAQVATRNLFTRKEWQALNPGSGLFACRYDTGYMFFTATDARLFWPSEAGATLTELSFADMPEAAYTDWETNNVYLAFGPDLRQWDADDLTDLNYLWKSKLHVTAKPVNFGVCKIDSNAGVVPAPLTLPGGPDDIIDAGGVNELAINGYVDINASSTPGLVMKLYGDGVLRHTQVVVNSEPFRLPGGYRAEFWEVELAGNAVVHALYLAETPAELKQLGV